MLYEYNHKLSTVGRTNPNFTNENNTADPSSAACTAGWLTQKDDFGGDTQNQGIAAPLLVRRALEAAGEAPAFDRLEAEAKTKAEAEKAARGKEDADDPRPGRKATPSSEGSTILICGLSNWARFRPRRTSRGNGRSSRSSSTASTRLLRRNDTHPRMQRPSQRRTSRWPCCRPCSMS